MNYAIESGDVVGYRYKLGGLPVGSGLCKRLIKYLDGLELVGCDGFSISEREEERCCGEK